MTVKCGHCDEFLADVTRLSDEVTTMVCANSDCTGGKAPVAVTGDKIGLQMLQALGLPTHGVVSFTISVDPQEIVVATVKSVVDKQRLEKVCEKYLARMKVEPDFREPESAPSVTDAPVPFDRPMR